MYFKLSLMYFISLRDVFLAVSPREKNKCYWTPNRVVANELVKISPSYEQATWCICMGAFSSLLWRTSLIRWRRLFTSRRRYSWSRGWSWNSNRRNNRCCCVCHSSSGMMYGRCIRWFCRSFTTWTYSSS